VAERLGAGFWRLFVSSATSNLADGIGRVTLPLLATTLTSDPLLISALTSLTFLPWLLFGMISGAIVDRVDRRSAMAASNLFRAGAIGVLAIAVVADRAGLVVLYAVALATGIAETIYDSAARAALPTLVRADQLESGNGLLASQEVVGQSFLGAPLGAALFAIAAAAPLIANAVGFALAAFLTLTLRRTPAPTRTTRTSLRRDVRDGLGWMWAHHLLRTLTLVTAVMGIGLYMTYGVLVLYVLHTLHGSQTAYGLIVAVAGAGSVLGGVSARWMAARVGRARAMLWSAVASALATLALGLTNIVLVATAFYTTAALAGTLWDVYAVSLRQALVPEHVLGRVQGSYRTIVWGAFPIGALSGGALASLTSVSTVFVAGGLVNIAASIWLRRTLRLHKSTLDAAFASGPQEPASASTNRQT
jgi:MFS family permease